MLDAPFATLNDTNHSELQSLEEIFNIITKGAKKINRKTQWTSWWDARSFRRSKASYRTYETSLPHKKTPTIKTSYKGAYNKKMKPWKTSKGGDNISAFCNTRVNQPHVPNNSNHNTQNSQTN